MVHGSGSPHREEVRALRRRAIGFLELAGEALRIENYDITCFLSEQAAQLYLKSILLEDLGDYPRLHSLRTLLSEVSRSRQRREIEAFLKENRARIIALEDSYIMARYTPRSYEREDAEELRRLAQRIIDLLEGS